MHGGLDSRCNARALEAAGTRPPCRTPPLEWIAPVAWRCGTVEEVRLVLVGVAAHRAGTMKLPFRGTITSVQPRIRLTRSFDQRSHTYLGYVLRLDGRIGAEQRAFTVAIGKAAQSKHELGLGYEISGEGEPVADPGTESAELYKVSQLAVHLRTLVDWGPPPPWLGSPPALEVYRERGHRRLDARTYETKCAACV